MLPRGFLKQHLPKIVIALVLTFVSGLVDIVGYLGIYQFFTAHLTGTTVHLGYELVQRRWVPAISAFTIVAAFVGGSILGRVLIQVGSRRRFRRIASFTLAIEAILLMSVPPPALGLQQQPYPALALLGAAMGLQTATLTGIGPLTVHTTFVTGMVNKLAQLISRMAFRAYDARRSKTFAQQTRLEQETDVQMASLLTGVWIFYVAGAGIGSWFFSQWGLGTLFLAACLLVLAVVTDQFWPLSIEEEKEQSER